MSKRIADKYLTDQNWDQEDNGEEDDDSKGLFKRADVEVLKTRVIRKAKRRVAGTESSNSSAFSGFSGLKSSTSNAGSMFKGFNPPSGNGNIQWKQSPTFQTLGSSGAATVQPKIESSIISQISTRPMNVAPIPTSGIKSSDEEMKDETNQNSREYNRHLSALNKSVSNWIKNHVEKNPLCDLTPIFLDYKKYLSEIDEKFGQSDNEGSQNSFQVSDSQETVSPKSSQNSSRTSNVSEKNKISLSGFGSKTEVKSDGEKDSNTQQSQILATKPLFEGFQTNTSSTSPFKGFNVSNKPSFSGFSFNSNMVGAGGNTAAQTTKRQEEKKTEEEYVPPKPESNVVVEDDAFHTIACKLFYKKDNAYVNKGVGQLYLKPSGEKTQLLIRADTATSQVLLNILLVPAIPVSKQGKNNILIMCIPNPPVNVKEKDKVAAFLIRVKTSDDADKLIEVIEQKKQECLSKTDAER